MATERAFAIAFLALGASFCCMEVASASCIVRGSRYNPPENDAVAWSAAVTGGTCTINFRSLGSLVFTGTSVASRPSGGTVVMAGNSRAEYRARAGFKGADSVAFRVCGQGRSGSGCSTITVQLSVD